MYKEHTGTWDRLAGNWKQFKGEVRKQWANLTDDDMEYIAGEHEKLVGRVQERYGIAKDEAANRVNRWLDNYPS